MLKKITIAALVSLLCLAEEVVLDGKLNETFWKNATVHSDFQEFKGNKNKVPMPKTSFLVHYDEHNVYFGIKCNEPHPDQIKAPKQPYPWGCDLVEIFLSPACRQDEFYQFVVSAGNVRWCQYYYEGGHIRPDPGYAPLWDSAVFVGNDFWSLEVRLPLAGFYHTRNALWQNKWLMNVTRERTVEAKTYCTWSPLINASQQSSLFRTLDGFPSRLQGDDLSIENVMADITSFDGKSYHGTLKMSIYSGTAGPRSISYNGFTKELQLAQGDNRVELPCRFEKVGIKDKMLFVVDKSNTLGRSYPVALDYEPVAIQLKVPSYSATFYPGQDKSKVIGIVRQRTQGKLKIEFKGNGVKPQTLTFDGKELQHDFTFDATGIDAQGATLHATVEGGEATLKINSPEPIKNRMVWIENGFLVLNGKPTFVRMVEGAGNGFGTGKRFFEMFKEDQDTFCINNDIINRVVVEPKRLLQGIESEAVKDVEPSPKLLELIKKRIEENRNKDFTYYYLCDEPECRNISPVYLEHVYKYVKSLDLFHPVMICSRSASRYVKCADYFSAHPYWAPYFDGRGNRLLTIPLDKIPTYFTGWIAPNKAGALVPQCFSYRNFWNRMADYPTLREIECAVWISIVTGVCGIETYHFHDLGDRPVLYYGSRYIMRSLERLDKFLLTSDKKKLPSPNKTFASLFTADNEQLLILVNVSGKPCTMSAPVKNLHEFLGNRVFNGSITLQNDETALFTTKKMDAGLENRLSTIKKIDELEAQRLKSKSVLFNKGFQLNLKASAFEHYGKQEWTHSKLFDGVDNMLAWGNYAKSPSWLEMSFSSFVPEFTSLVIHGSNLDDMNVQYWKDGGWKQISEIAEMVKDKYRTTFKCNNRIRTVKLRLEFPKGKNTIELYEVEAFDDAPQKAAMPQQTPQKQIDDKDNVLWRKDGSNAVLEKKGWHTKVMKVFGDDNGRLVISGEKQPKEISPVTDVDFPISPEYPWLVFKLESVKMNEGKYHAWCVQGPVIGGYFQDTSPIPGIYTMNLKEAGIMDKKRSFIAVYAYCEELAFSEISIVKKTDCEISADLKDDVLTVKACLTHPAESLSAKICHRSKELTSEYQLKPTDDSRLIWQGTFKLEKPLQSGKLTHFKRGQLDLRVDVLGGNIQVPVFYKIYQEY